MRGRRGGGAGAIPEPTVAGELVTIAAELASIDARLRRIESALSRLAVPDERATTREAVAILRCSRRKLERLNCRGLFTDARPREERRPRVPRLYYTAELEAWLTEGAAGVRRLRKELGRL